MLDLQKKWTIVLMTTVRGEMELQWLSQAIKIKTVFIFLIFGNLRGVLKDSTSL